MYIFSLTNPKRKIKTLFKVLAACIMLAVLITAALDIFIDDNQAVEKKSEGYPGEPIRVITDNDFESLSVWEAIINHYSFQAGKNTF